MKTSALAVLSLVLLFGCDGSPERGWTRFKKGKISSDHCRVDGGWLVSTRTIDSHGHGVLVEFFVPDPPTAEKSEKK